MSTVSTLTPIRQQAASSADRVAIVFIHGFGGDYQATWQRFPEFLGADVRLSGWDIYTLGYDSHLRVDVVKLWSADPDLQKIADKLAGDVRAGALVGYRSLVLIAHSMGGLVVQRALLDSAALRQRVSHVFLFGTPSNGLMKASLVRWLKPQLRDMSSDGAFIRRLRSDWDGRFSRANGKRLSFMLSVAGGLRDEFVPYESSVEPFPEAAYPDARFIVPGDHLAIVKPATPDSESVLLVINRLVGDAPNTETWNAARLAVESRDFERALELLEHREDELDQEGLVQLALSLEGVGRQQDAIDLLKRHGNSGTDAMGVLAGRLKRRWLLGRGAEDAAMARTLYAQALELALAADDFAQAYYHAINVAFFELFADKARPAARKTAALALKYCARAAATEVSSNRKWRLATEAEAMLHLGRTEEAYARYRQAAAPEQQASPRELDSMLRQATYLSREIGDLTMRRELMLIFRQQDQA